MEHIIKQIADKQDWPLQSKLAELKETFYDRLDIAGTSQLYEEQFARFLSSEAEDEQQRTFQAPEDKRMSGEILTQQSRQSQALLHSQGGAAEPDAGDHQSVDEQVNEIASRDFEEFYAQIKAQKFANIIQLCEVVICHFIDNRRRHIPACLNRLCEFQHGHDSFEFCPSLLLSNVSAFKNLRSLVVKLYLRCLFFTRNFCQGSADTASYLTLMELLFEKRGHFLKKYIKENIQALTQKQMDKLAQINRGISQFIVEFLKFENTNTHFRIRVFHILALYYSEKDFENEIFARQCLLSLSKEFEQGGHYSQQLSQESVSSPGLGDYLYNVFWTEGGYIKCTFKELVESRLQENHISYNNLHQIKQLAFNSEMEFLLKQLLDKLEAKSRENMEEACDLYYKQILELISKVDKVEQFIPFFYQIYRIYVRQVQLKNPHDDYKRTIIRMDLLMRIDSLQLQFLNQWNAEAIRSALAVSTDLADTVLRLNLLMLKVIVIKYILIDYDSNHYVLLRLYVQLSDLLQEKLKGDPSEIQAKFLFFIHFIIHHLSSDSHLHDIHKHLIADGLVVKKISHAFKYLSDCKRKAMQEEQQSKAEPPHADCAPDQKQPEC